MYSILCKNYTIPKIQIKYNIYIYINSYKNKIINKILISFKRYVYVVVFSYI